MKRKTALKAFDITFCFAPQFSNDGISRLYTIRRKAINFAHAEQKAREYQQKTVVLSGWWLQQIKRVEL